MKAKMTSLDVSAEMRSELYLMLAEETTALGDHANARVLCRARSPRSNRRTTLKSR